MLLYLAINLGLILVALVAIWYKLDFMADQKKEELRLLAQIEYHQLNPRTRLGSKVLPQTGPPSEVKTGHKLARASASRRRVVGGDPESALYSTLNRTPEKDNDDDDR